MAEERSFFRFDLNKIASDSEDYLEVLYTRAPHAKVSCASPDGSVQEKILPLESLQVSMLRIPPTFSTPRQSLPAETLLSVVSGSGLIVVEKSQTYLRKSNVVIIPSGLQYSLTNDSMSEMLNVLLVTNPPIYDPSERKVEPPS